MSKNPKNPFDRLQHDNDLSEAWEGQSLAFLEMIRRTTFHTPRCLALAGWDATTIQLTPTIDPAAHDIRRGSDKRDDRYAVKNLLLGLSEPKVLAGPSTSHAIDEMAAALFARAPNFAPAIEAMRNSAQLQLRQGARWFKIAPIIVESAPGAGKTRLANLLGEVSGLPLIYLDCATMTNLTPILGQDASWGNARSSEILQAMATSRVANPIVVLDEFDKAQNHGRNANPQPSESLVGLLEPRSAASHLDHFTQAILDLRFINWVILVNDLSRLSRPFLDRCQVIRLSPLAPAEIAEIAAREIERRGLEQELVAALVKAVRNGQITSLRTLNKALDAAETASARPILN